MDETGRRYPGSLNIERDPAGLPPHAPGAKLDGEKVMAELTLDGFSRALLAVAEVSTYGARKYSPGGWQHVEDGQTRYRRAGDRHRLARGHEPYDLESGLLHLAHEAWNRLAELELRLRVEQSEEGAKATSPAGRHTGAPDAAPEQAATEENRAAGKPAGDTWHAVVFDLRGDGILFVDIRTADTDRDVALSIFRNETVSFFGDAYQGCDYGTLSLREEEYHDLFLWSTGLAHDSRETRATRWGPVCRGPWNGTIRLLARKPGDDWNAAK